MTIRLVVVGAGGFGREALDVVDAINRTSKSGTFELIGVLDDTPSEANLTRLDARGAAYLGMVDDWLVSSDDAAYSIAVGDPHARRALVERFDSAGRHSATLVHPQAVIGSAGSTGAGSIVCSGVQVSTNVRLGKHVHLNPNATIGHDSTLDDYVSVNPAATISGECRVHSGARVGAACVILQGLAVGSGATVGAAACVIRDVARGVTVKGVPAR